MSTESAAQIAQTKNMTSAVDTRDTVKNTTQLAAAKSLKPADNATDEESQIIAGIANTMNATPVADARDFGKNTTQVAAAKPLKPVDNATTNKSQIIARTAETTNATPAGDAQDSTQNTTQAAEPKPQKPVGNGTDDKSHVEGDVADVARFTNSTANSSVSVAPETHETRHNTSDGDAGIGNRVGMNFTSNSTQQGEEPLVVANQSSNGSKPFVHVATANALETPDADGTQSTALRGTPSHNARQTHKQPNRVPVHLLPICAVAVVALVCAVWHFGNCGRSSTSFQRLINDPRTPKRFGRARSGGRALEQHLEF